MGVGFRRLSAPITVQWETTSLCNKSCVHCYNYWRDSTSTLVRSGARLNAAGARAVVEQVLANRVFHVVITGGEPLLVVDDLLPHCRELVDQGVLVTFNSNLMGFGPSEAAGLREAGVESILGSLPASTQETDKLITGNPDSFYSTVDGIRTALEFGFNLSVNMVVSRKNLDDVGATAQLAHSLGVRRFTASRALRPANAVNFDELRLTRHDFGSLAMQMKDIKEELGLSVGSVEGYPLCALDDSDLRDEIGFNRACNAGKTFCVMGTSGAIRPCTHLEESHSGDLQEAWVAMEAFRRVSERLPLECADCVVRYSCGGGCKADALHESDSYRAADSLCDPTANVQGVTRVSTVDYECGCDRFAVHSAVRFRREAFGGVVFRDPQRWLAVGPDTYRFLTGPGRDGFRRADLLSVLNDPGDVDRLIAKFLATGLVVV